MPVTKKQKRRRARFPGKQPGPRPRIKGFQLKDADVKIRTAYNKLYRFFKNHPDFKDLPAKDPKQVDLIRYVYTMQNRILMADHWDLPFHFRGRRLDGSVLVLDLRAYLREQKEEQEKTNRVTAIQKIKQHRTKR